MLSGTLRLVFNIPTLPVLPAIEQTGGSAQLAPRNPSRFQFQHPFDFARAPVREKHRRRPHPTVASIPPTPRPPKSTIAVTMFATSAVSMAARQMPLARVPSALIRTMPAQVLIATRGYATPSGPPPKNFRLPPPKAWDQESESTLDRVGKYFLVTEMLRGMYLLMEQFFRPP